MPKNRIFSPSLEECQKWSRVLMSYPPIVKKKSRKRSRCGLNASRLNQKLDEILREKGAILLESEHFKPL